MGDGDAGDAGGVEWIEISSGAVLVGWVMVRRASDPNHYVVVHDRLIIEICEQVLVRWLPMANGVVLIVLENDGIAVLVVDGAMVVEIVRVAEVLPSEVVIGGPGIEPSKLIVVIDRHVDVVQRPSLMGD